ncbi:MAG: hypothetical protein R3337_11110 [Gammaproteobacteria bacterium]|nr:hypothetical protein [Gammaproteobacteria bacterium]
MAETLLAKGACRPSPGERIPPAGTFPRKLIRGAAALMEQNRSAGLDNDEQTGAGRWDGGGMDWGVAIHALFEADGLTKANPVASGL